VTVTKKDVEIDESTCHKLEREESAALAVKEICKDRPYEIKVAYTDQYRNTSGFTVTVHLAMARRPLCREDALTCIVKKGNGVIELDTNVKKFVYVRALDTEKYDMHHGGIGTRQVLQRVAEIHVDAMKKAGSMTNPVAMWCNTKLAHVHHVSLVVFLYYFFVGAEFTSVSRATATSGQMCRWVGTLTLMARRSWS
jgi:hypothetical protein